LLKTRLINADRQVHPGIDFLGWYATGSDLQEVDVKIHSKMLEINGTSLFMLYNPAKPEGSNNESLWLFESGEQEHIFVVVLVLKYSSTDTDDYCCFNYYNYMQRRIHRLGVTVRVRFLQGPSLNLCPQRWKI